MNDFRDRLSEVILPIYAKVLWWFLVILAEYHILWNLLQYVIWDLHYNRYEKRLGLLLIAAGTLYLILSAAADPPRLKKTVSIWKKTLSFEQIILITLFFWYILVCVIRGNIDGRPCLKHNDNRLFIQWCSTFVLFPFSRLIGMRRARKTIEGMFHIAAAIYTPICLWALTKFLRAEEVILLSGKAIAANEDGALMIGGHQNITGAASAVMLAISIHMIMMKRKWIRLLYTAAAIVHAVVVILTNSRTSFIATAFLLLAILIVLNWDRIESLRKAVTKDKSKALHIAAGVAICIVLVFLLLYIRKWIMMMSAGAMDKTDTMKARDFTDLNGRNWIWRVSFMIMFNSKENFFFGVTPAYVSSALYKTGLIYSAIKQPHAHNLLLQVGLSLGVPAMIVYAVFLVSVIRRCIRIIREKAVLREDGRVPKLWDIAIIVLFLLVFEIAEVTTFAVNRFNLPVFFILAGWITAYDLRIHGNGSYRKGMGGLRNRVLGK